MRLLAASMLLAVGCSTPDPEPIASVTLYGREQRIESWKAFVVERGHFHADLSDYPCLMALYQQATDVFRAMGAVEDAESLKTSQAALRGDFCAKQTGPVYGGPDRLVLGLCRFGENPEMPVETLIFDFPRLAPDEIEHRFNARDFVAAWERPPKTVAARLERGWVRVRRLNPGDGLLPPRYDFEVFVVLAPASGDGAPTQVITRVSAPPQ